MAEATGTGAVEGILDASEAIDLDAYLPHVTEDVVIHPPVFVIGPGELRGHAGIRDGLRTLREALGTTRKLQLGERRYFRDRADESKVLVGIEITIADRTTGDSFGTQASMLCTVVDGKVAKIESYTTREDGLAQLQDPVEVDV
jgi:ketosteroid isomerase-like protein